MGQVKDSTRGMASQVETRGLFLQEEAVPEGQRLGSWMGGGDKGGPPTLGCTHIPWRRSNRG